MEKNGPLHANEMHAIMGNVKEHIHIPMYAKGIAMIITMNPIMYVRIGPMRTMGQRTIHVKRLRRISHDITKIIQQSISDIMLKGENLA